MPWGSMKAKKDEVILVMEPVYTPSLSILNCIQPILYLT